MPLTDQTHPAPPHQIILASAGSGKTYALTTRILRLLADGAPVESIIALTFSKASGAEFFTRVLSRLGQAALEDAAAQKLALEVGHAELNKVGWQAILQNLVQNWHRLTLGTMDSFFVRIARSFSLELGLNGDFTLLDAHGQSVAKYHTYSQIFQAEEDQAQRDFIDAFHLSTFGEEQYSLRKNLDAFIDRQMQNYLACPDQSRWGKAPAIWDVSPDFLRLSKSLTQCRQELAAALEQERTRLSPYAGGKFEEFLDQLENHYTAGSAWGDKLKPFKDFISKLIEAGSKLGGPECEIVLRKRFILPPRISSASIHVLQAIIRDEFVVRLKRTEGIWKVLKHYDATYHRQIRRRGQLTFTDVQMLISGTLPEDAGQQEYALDVEKTFFRLDNRYQHWLLDEFQDTSIPQWQILEKLAGEVLIDDSRERSFFAVGDLKQSIYRWRGGAPEIFQRLLEDYRERIQVATLSKSYRSSPSVLRFVNELFGDSAALARVLPAQALEGWRFEAHTTDSTASGHAALLRFDKNTAPEEQRIAEVLRQIDPVARGWSCAVLVIRNKRAVALAESLRASTGFPVITSGKAFFTQDNPVTLALLDLLAAAAHPGNGLAAGHVRLSPIHAALQDNSDEPNKQGYLYDILRRISLGGIAQTLEHVVKKLSQSLRQKNVLLDPFSCARVEDLLTLAREYDATGSRDIDAFLEMAAQAEQRLVPAPGAIQVITWNKSKGLEYDLVIVAELDDRNHGNTWKEDATCVDEHQQLQWVARLPNKECATYDATIRQNHERITARAWQENICKLYVALTRAKRSTLVMLPTPAKAPSENARLDKLVEALMHGKPSDALPEWPGLESEWIYSVGDPTWYLEKEAKVVRTRRMEEELNLLPPTCPAWLKAQPAAVKTIRPSQQQEHGVLSLRELLTSSEHKRAADLGSAVHQILSHIHWLENTPLKSVLSKKWPTGACSAVERFFQNPANLAHFSQKNHPGAEVWREQPFRVFTASGPLSGIFDRVHIWYGSDGKTAQEAEILEFKLSAENAADHASRQTELYREALSKLLSLPLESVRVTILSIF